MEQVFRHYSCEINENKRTAIEEWTWENGFANLYFEELTDNKIWLHVYIPENEELPSYLLELELFDAGTSTPEEWFRKWKEMLHPFELCPGIEIVPLEEENQNIYESSKIGIVPGIAFGTGLHETTRLCAKKLKKYLEKDQSVLDVGCGTGILSVMTRKLGAKNVVGLDVEPLAIEKSLETMRVNGVEFDLRESNFLSALKEDEVFDIIVSNMIVELLNEFYKDLKKHMKSESILILSGINENKFEEFKSKALEEFELVEMEGENEWRALVLKKK